MKGGRASPVSLFGGTRKKGQVYVSRSSRSSYVGVSAHDIGKLAHLTYIVSCYAKKEEIAIAETDVLQINKPLDTCTLFYYLRVARITALPLDLPVPPIISHTEY